MTTEKGNAEIPQELVDKFADSFGFDKCPVCGLRSSMPANSKVMTPTCRVTQTGTIHPNGDMTFTSIPENCPNVVSKDNVL